MASLLRSSCNVATPRSATRAPRTAVRPVLVRAVEQETTTEPAAAPEYSTPDPNKAMGFVAKDTAGQANMYPVVTKAFEAGSDLDTDKTGETGTRTAALAGGAVAAALVAAGLFALAGSSGQPEVIQGGDYLALSAYKDKFASELGLNTAPAVVVMAPDVVLPPTPTLEAAPAPEVTLE